MTILALLLALVALVLFLIAAFDRAGTNTNGRVLGFVPLGLAFLTGALICQFLGLGSVVKA